MRRTMRMLAVTVCAIPLAAAAEPVGELPEPSTSPSGVRYVSGGVGFDERDTMELMARNYNLEVVMALDTGAYLAGLDVTIARQDGETVLETTTHGPWLFAELEPGTYTITAAGDRPERARTVDVGQEHTRIVMTWPDRG